jgi:hypothetical protein
MENNHIPWHIYGRKGNVTSGTSEDPVKYVHALTPRPTLKMYSARKELNAGRCSFIFCLSKDQT